MATKKATKKSVKKVAKPATRKGGYSLTDEGRDAISRAQVKRWAKYRKLKRKKAA